MDWFAAVDIYCERTSAAFWAEPVNALTNLAVLVPVLWAAARAQRQRETDPVIWALIGLAAAIGAGSFLFHTAATRWAEVADTVPIWAFLALYAHAATDRLLGLRPARPQLLALALVAVLVLVFVANGEGAALAADAGRRPNSLNGSGQYLPAAAAAAVLAAVVWRGRHPQRGWVAAACLSFAAAITLRTLDAGLCSSLPLGTHFLWHVLNVLTLGLALRALLDGRGGASAAPAGGVRHPLPTPLQEARSR